MYNFIFTFRSWMIFINCKTWRKTNFMLLEYVIAVMAYNHLSNLGCLWMEC